MQTFDNTKAKFSLCNPGNHLCTLSVVFCLWCSHPNKGAEQYLILLNAYVFILLDIKANPLFSLPPNKDKQSRSIWLAQLRRSLKNPDITFKNSEFSGVVRWRKYHSNLGRTNNQNNSNFFPTLQIHKTCFPAGIRLLEHQKTDSIYRFNSSKRRGSI